MEQNSLHKHVLRADLVDMMPGLVDMMPGLADMLPGLVDMLPGLVDMSEVVRGHKFSSWGRVGFSSSHKNCRGHSCFGQCMYTVVL